VDRQLQQSALERLFHAPVQVGQSVMRIGH
jgi:hypothetical protein